MSEKAKTHGLHKLWIQSHRNISLLNHMTSGIAKNHHTIIPVLPYTVFTGIPPSSVIYLLKVIFLFVQIFYSYMLS